MTRKTQALAAVAAAACALLPAASASAATKQVTLGLPEAPSGLPADASLHDWFPRKVKVNVGDTVAFTPHGFGYPVVGKGAIPPVVAPDPSVPVEGAKGPDDQPLWFNGQPSFRVNPFHLRPTGDGEATRRGLDASGLSMEDGPPEPYEVEFTRTGAFKVRDGMHPDVAMKVVVVPRGRKVPSRSADRAAVARQVRRLVERAKRLAKVEPRSGTILAGNDTRNVAFYRFFGDATVRAGEPVTFKLGRRSLDVHNLVMGPIDWLKDVPPFEVRPPDFFIAGIAAYPSQPPTAPLTFDGSQNGGFFNTGTLFDDRDTGFPRKATFTITQPGTYTYYCQFHGPDMQGTLTVQ